MNYNKVMIGGNLTRDPELRMLPSNTGVVSFGLAVNRKWKSRDGESKEEVAFVDVEAFGRTAEVINQYVNKGDPLFIEGRLKLDQWQDRDGNNRSKLKVIAEHIQLMGSRGGGNGSSGGNGQQRGGGDHEPINEDDIPF